MNIRDFFALNEEGVPIQKPINRNAFSKEDVEYKLKYIKEGIKAGFEITIDNVANIAITVPGKVHRDKSVVGISHTDSVDNGGQFDGALGVFVSMQTAEDIKKSGKQNLVNYKAIIAMCEESTVFEGVACIGSKYLRGDKIDFDAMKSRNGKSLREEVAGFKKELFRRLDEEGLTDRVREVERVVEPGEIITAIEGHIEQANVLEKCKRSIGICTSIASSYRMKANTSDIRTAAKFICNLNESARRDDENQVYRATVSKFSIKADIDENRMKDEKEEFVEKEVLNLLDGGREEDFSEEEKDNFIKRKILTLRFKGEQNHSGATSMRERKDAVYGAAEFINILADNPDIEFLETYTKEYGPNQITDICDVKFAINPNASAKSIFSYWLAQKDARKLADVMVERMDDIEEHESDPGLFIDIRQQIGTNSKLTADMIWETTKDMIEKTGCPMRIDLVSKGEPYQTTPELVETAAEICENNSIMYKKMPSWAGHDLATLTRDKNARTLLLFGQSENGSHNFRETTNMKSINKLIKVQSTLAQQELERANQLFCEEELENSSVQEESSR